MRGIAIIAAAGSGSRVGRDKIWEKAGGMTLLERSARPFLASPVVDEVILVVRADRTEDAKALFAGAEKPVTVVVGGATRTASVRAALDLIKSRGEWENTVVAVHDGARPYVSPDLIERCMTVASEVGSAVPVVPCSDSLRLSTATGSKAVDRSQYVAVQTPQCFLFERLYEAYDGAQDATDDATLYEKKFGFVTLTDGDVENKKITYLSDLFGLYDRRVGEGYDVHPLAEGRPLVLGGVTIPFEKGLVGHSDGDALVHAIMDALLTAADLPDIGHYFPPSDPQYEGIYSIELLRKVRDLIREKGFCVENVSATVMAERPKLAPYFPEMKRIVAESLEISPERVRFAATTTEGLGIVGEGRGIAANAVALLVRAR